jgi:hypothetical protein
LLKAESRRADGTAAAAPKSVPGQNTFRIAQRQRRKQAATARPSRRIRPESWASLNAAIAKEQRALALLKPDSPRVRPTLARLREPA